MIFKEYKNMDSFELEKHLQKILESEKAKEFPKYAEIEKLYKELKQQKRNPSRVPFFDSIYPKSTSVISITQKPTSSA